jgi:tetratricopeptide (TPR) repeat protein
LSSVPTQTSPAAARESGGPSGLYGRDAILDRVAEDAARGQTLFALEGLTGVGKSALLGAVTGRLASAGFTGIANLNAAQLLSESSTIASIYVQLQHLGKDPEALIEAIEKRVVSELPKVLRTILGAVMADLAKLATDKAGKTIDAVQGIISGKELNRTVETQLSTLDNDNLRYFVNEFLHAVADAGNPIVLAVDNFDAADVGLVSLVRNLIKNKPARVALVIAQNTEVGDNANWDNILADVRAQGGDVLAVESLNRAAIGAWYTNEVGRRPTDTELDELEANTHGRAMDLKLVIDAIRDGVQRPFQRDYAGYYERARRKLSADSRTVAELLAVINRDAMVSADLLALAAENLNLSNIAPAIDQLQDGRLLKSQEGHVALAHSLAQQSFATTINSPRRHRLAQAWFAAVGSFDLPRLTGPEATGLIPIIAQPLIESRAPGEIAQIGERLIAVGQIRSGLELLDQSWKPMTGALTVPNEVFQQILVAARTRLELGRYAEATEPLDRADATAKDSAGRIEVLLLRMKLALRQNVYEALWKVAGKLEEEAGLTTDAQMESELILNVAYRDLMDVEGIRRSSEHLVQLRDQVSARKQNSADRALARSLAKLGENEAALARAHAAVDAKAHSDSVRGIGNAQLALGEVLRYRREFEPAVVAYETAANIGRATSNRDSELLSLLGKAAAQIEGGESAPGLKSLDEVSALLKEPGYRHPLEAAHARLLAKLAGSTLSADDVLLPYEAFGISWPNGYLHSFLRSGQLSGPIPI